MQINFPLDFERSIRDARDLAVCQRELISAAIWSHYTLLKILVPSEQKEPMGDAEIEEIVVERLQEFVDKHFGRHEIRVE